MIEQDHDLAAAPPLDCADFVLMVDDLVDSDPHQWGAIVRRHLRDCPPCQVYLEQMHDLRVLLGQAYDAEKLSDEHVRSVLTAIHAIRKDLGR
ncbi:hypothetical protein [Amycolatopsis alkalitolerans]|uniref:Zf-HC2 domain-containing protein n=1 Tax=Amycolatopsis alkalitolerans TaxID=2547244 RepID=A0A5C4M8G7_9PSEU|nr:hypothetical protein [Amycolatopsis alkalitolerans]TNC28052.1 hypothetical protein FG385_06370 [Amycolatopsis alkalitolerans]